MGEAIRARIGARPSVRCKADGPLDGAITAACYTVLFSVLPAATAWRVMFWIGILPALLVFYIRRNVPEPEIFRQTRTREADLGKGSRFLEIFSSGTTAKTTLLTALLVCRRAGRLLRHHHLAADFPEDHAWTVGARHRRISAGGDRGLVHRLPGQRLAGGPPGSQAHADCSLRLGSLLSVFGYTYLPIGNSAMLFLGFPLGFFASGSFSPIGAFFTELFPTRLRGSGQGFSYNFGRGIGALFPTLVGYLSARLGLGHAISTFAVIRLSDDDRSRSCCCPRPADANCRCTTDISHNVGVI